MSLFTSLYSNFDFFYVAAHTGGGGGGGGCWGVELNTYLGFLDHDKLVLDTMFLYKVCFPHQ